MSDFEKVSLRRMALDAKKISESAQVLAEQWDELDLRSRDDEMLSLSRQVRTLARLLRNIRNGME